LPEVDLRKAVVEVDIVSVVDWTPLEVPDVALAITHDERLCIVGHHQCRAARLLFVRDAALDHKLLQRLVGCNQFDKVHTVCLAAPELKAVNLADSFNLLHMLASELLQQLGSTLDPHVLKRKLLQTCSARLPFEQRATLSLYRI